MLMKPMLRTSLIVPALLLSLTVASPAAAYIGPGAGLSAIGTIAALVGAILLLLIGFIWYPVKRLMRKRSATGRTSATAEKKG